MICASLTKITNKTINFKEELPNSGSNSKTTAKETSFGTFIAEFYTRRVRRLMPPLLFYLIFGAILYCMFSLNNRLPMSCLETGAWAIGGISNIFLAFVQTTGYFAPSAEFNMFLHTWSLGVEEQFYLFFPLLVYSTYYIAARNKAEATTWNNNAPNIFVILVIVFSLISFVVLSFSYFSSLRIKLSLTTTWDSEFGSLVLVFSSTYLILLDTSRLRKKQLSNH